MKTLLSLFLTFLKIGTVTFGGGYAMIPALRHETVKVRGWMNEEEMTDCIALCQSLPGALIVNAAVFIGKKIKGDAGAVSAALGMVLPAFFSILLILVFLGQYQGNHYLMGALAAIKAVSVGLITVTAWQIARSTAKGFFGILLAVASFLLVAFFEVNAVWAIIASGIAGYLEYLYRSKKRGERP